MMGDYMTRRWRRKPPDKDGWWRFREDGIHEERILIVRGWVASDDEWEQATGRAPVDSENYWEGNDSAEMTFGPLTEGVWMFDGENQNGKEI